MKHSPIVYDLFKTKFTLDILQLSITESVYQEPTRSLNLVIICEIRCFHIIAFEKKTRTNMSSLLPTNNQSCTY